MRLQVAFVVLLLAASTATSLGWMNLATAREGDTWARVLVFSLAVVAAACVVLLCRIVLKVKSAGRQAGGKSS